MQWEDPIRTLGSYVGLVSILSGVHYLHPTQLALKIAATALGGKQLDAQYGKTHDVDVVS